MSSVLNTGAVLRGRYKIDKLIYEAPLVNIYYCRDLHMSGRFWAVREMQIVAADPAEKSAVINGFLKDASFLSQISHPYIAKVMDFFADGTYLYIIREFVPGADLASLLESRHEPFTEEQVAGWAAQISELFQYFSLKKLPPIFFREFNMGNIIVNQKSEIKLTDIGLAKIFYGDTGLSAIGRMGACEYAAPEQYAEHPSFDSRTLVYTLGAFMYHALTNVNPSAESDEPHPANILNPSVSSAMSLIIKKAVEKNPQKRYQTIADMRKALSSSLKTKKQSGPVQTKAYDSESSSSNNLLFISATILLMGIIIFLGYYFFIR